MIDLYHDILKFGKVMNVSGMDKSVAWTPVSNILSVSDIDFLLLKVLYLVCMFKYNVIHLDALSIVN